MRFGTSIMSYISGDEPDSFISKYVEKHGNGIQHIGVKIDDIHDHVAEPEAKGVTLDKAEMADEACQETFVGP